MTLAKILLTSISCIAWSVGAWSADAPHAAQADSATTGAASPRQQEGTTASPVPAEVKPPKQSAPSTQVDTHSKTNAKRARQKKKKTVACAETRSVAEQGASGAS